MQIYITKNSINRFLELITFQANANLCLVWFQEIAVLRFGLWVEDVEHFFDASMKYLKKSELTQQLDPHLA